MFCTVFQLPVEFAVVLSSSQCKLHAMILLSRSFFIVTTPRSSLQG